MGRLLGNLCKRQMQYFAVVSRDKDGKKEANFCYCISGVLLLCFFFTKGSFCQRHEIRDSMSLILRWITNAQLNWERNT